MRETVRVELGERGYDINIGRKFEELLGIEGGGVSALLVSDSNVDPLYGDSCADVLNNRGFHVARVVVPAGESTKSLDYAKELFDAALAAKLDRASFVVALGGGVVGDLAGFAAATYLRGVKLLQLPTSLLAMVDSSVGGKTAVNLPQGKNLVGVFYQPVEVCIDIDTLRTLPDREYISGMAEIVKYGIIWDSALFDLLEENAVRLRERDYDILEGIVARCCEIKAEVVAMDERESGVRAILNYGHTLGHAIENTCGYGELLHGEAIAIGMAYAGELSCRCNGMGRADCQRINRLLTDLGLSIDKSKLPDAISWEKLREVMSADKKSQMAIPKFVLAKAIGEVDFGCSVTENLLSESWEESLG